MQMKSVTEIFECGGRGRMVPGWRGPWLCIFSIDRPNSDGINRIATIVDIVGGDLEEITAERSAADRVIVCVIATPKHLQEIVKWVKADVGIVHWASVVGNPDDFLDEDDEYDEDDEDAPPAWT